jgi:HAD superfamily hydrolase (TIGR01509 family)
MGKLIIFDCDGVLVDTEPLANMILAEWLTEAGWPMTTEDSIRMFKGGRLRDIQATAERHIGRSLGTDWIARLHAYEFEIFKREVKAIPGVAAVMDQLDGAKIPYCVASQGPVHKMEITLGTVGIWPRVEGRVYSADMVSRPKPAPDLFLHAAASMGMASADCTVIEDSTTGVKGAKAAGMRVFGFAADNDPEALRDAGADWVFLDMVELPDKLGLG